MHQRFRDRREAGRLLASELKNEKGEETIVLGIPRGGIPVAAEIARALGCTPEVLLCKKIGHPVQKEYAIGAVNLSDAYLIPHKDVEAEYVDQEIVHIRQRLEEMKIKFNISKTTPLEKKTVILADDGMATGRTMMAAVRLIRKSKPRKLILAIPVASESALKLLRPEVDQLICLYQPDRFSGVGAFYEHFEEFADEDVIRELKTFEKSEV
jgi:predicted phosphoribosyltransferase